MYSKLLDQLLVVPEVQDGIFCDQALNQGDFARCARVSKTWQKVVTPFLWRVLHGSDKQLALVNQQGVLANAEWIRDLTVTRWEVVDWLIESEKSERVNRLKLQLPCPSPNSEPLLQSMFTNGSDDGNDNDDDEEAVDQQERIVSALVKLIHQNSGLTDFACNNTGCYPGIFHHSVIKALIHSCTFNFSRLELVYLSLENSNLGDLLKHCTKVQDLVIHSCTFMANHLDGLDGKLVHLQRLKFTSNVVYVDPLRTQIHLARGQELLKLLKAFNKSQRFECLEVESKRWTEEESSEWIDFCGSSNASVTHLTLLGCLASDQALAMVLNVVQPLKILRLSQIPCAGQSLAVVREKHQATLQEFEILSREPEGQVRGLLTKLQWPKLRTLKLDCKALSFETLVPGLYPAVQHGQNNIDQIVQQESHDWTCLGLVDLEITFTLDPELELLALGGNWTATVTSVEELFCKAFKLLIDQIAKLPQLSRVQISMKSGQDLDTMFVGWKNLDGCWHPLTNCRDLKEVSIDWPVPLWIQDNYTVWHQPTFAR